MKGHENHDRILRPVRSLVKGEKTELSKVLREKGKINLLLMQDREENKPLLLSKDPEMINLRPDKTNLPDQNNGQSDPSRGLRLDPIAALQHHLNSREVHEDHLPAQETDNY